jgi:hypothetical protein
MLNALNQSRKTTSSRATPNDRRMIRYEKQVKARATLPMLDWPSDLFSRDAVVGSEVQLVH